MGWSRTGNFYESIMRGRICGAYVEHFVQFINCESIAVIRTIAVQQKSDGSIMVILQPTPFFLENVLILLQTIFKNSPHIWDWNFNAAKFEINFNCEESLNGLILLFEQLNNKYNKKLFSEELIVELKNIYQFQYEENTQSLLQLNSDLLVLQGIKGLTVHRQSEEKVRKYSHILPEYKDLYRYTNPKRISSTELNKVLNILSKEFDENKFKRLLAYGENTNQLDMGRMRPLHYALVHHRNIKALKRLLIYGADPYLIINFNFENAFDLARKRRDIAKLEVLLSAISSLEKPLQEGSFTVASKRINYNNQRINTVLTFLNGVEISTEIKSIRLLTTAEIEALFVLFCRTFEVPGDKDNKVIKEIFLQDITHPKKFIEIIRDNGKIIGCNLFELIQTRSNQNTLYLNCDYALIDPAYRGYGLMSLLIFRMSYALQQRLPKHKIAVFFCAVHFNSYRLVAGNLKDIFLHFPMHRPDYMNDSFLKEILDIIFAGDDYNLIRDEALTCYLEDEVQVRERPNAQPRNDLLYNFFNKHLRGITKADDKKTRSVPVIFYVDSMNFAKLLQICCSMKLDFRKFTTELSTIITLFLVSLGMAELVKQMTPPDEGIFERLDPATQFWCFLPTTFSARM